MRYSKGHKEETHRQIVKNAAVRFRRDGFDGAGIASLMADSGLTHGGFYAHFKSKEDLFRATISWALKETFERLSTAAYGAKSKKRLEAIVEAYLSTMHRDHAGHGCIAAVQAPDIARQSSDTRQHFINELDPIIELIEAQLPEGGSRPARKQRAYAVFASMIGSMQMSRAFTEARLSDNMLAAGRAAAIAIATAPWKQDARKTTAGAPASAD